MIHVDIPVVLEKANVVFNMDHLAFAGDLPVGINYMYLLANRFKEMKTKGQIIGVFHGDAAYMTLNDEAYNAYRKVTTGNPYSRSRGSFNPTDTGRLRPNSAVDITHNVNNMFQRGAMR
ncbi:MAG: hypothetical protein NTY86_12515 [Deltaproteobacteria bacterium]|nr:hypothetical protein [Deltaproteobacteria bacterium]